MFKGLHTALQKAKPSEMQTKHPEVIAIQSADSLLSTEKRQGYLKNIKTLLNLPPKLYDSLYHQVLKQFAEFCQNLPETQHGIFGHEGGFLDHGLERASRALSLCLNHFFSQEKSFQSASPQEALWIFAVFTAALLLDVGKIGVKYEIELCNKDGSSIKTWLPFTPVMPKQGKFYRFNFVKRNLDNLRKLINSLLARQILDHASEEGDGTVTPIRGFNWIASNPDVLETWLILLQGEKRLPMTSFMSVIPLAEAQIVEQYFLQHPITHPHSTNTLFDTPQTDQIPPTSTQMGDDFLRWIRDKLANEKITVNQEDSAVHTVEEGVLLNPSLFEKFLQERKANYQQTVSPGSVEQQFRQLVEAFWDSPATIQQRHVIIRGVAAQELHRFILVANRSLLFVPGYQPEISKNIVPAAAPITAAVQQEKRPNQKTDPSHTYHV